MEIENESSFASKPMPKNIWMHGLTVAVLLALTHIALMLMGACGVMQFFWMLISKERNDQIIAFGNGLGDWLSKTAGFMTGKSEDKPFPWAQWKSS
jgi:Domain of unknown function (DUF4389)